MIGFICSSIPIIHQTGNFDVEPGLGNIDKFGLRVLMTKPGQLTAGVIVLVAAPNSDAILKRKFVLKIWSKLAVGESLGQAGSLPRVVFEQGGDLGQETGIETLVNSSINARKEKLGGGGEGKMKKIEILLGHLLKKGE